MPLDLSAFVSLIDSGNPFAFSRWGDGEFNCLLGVKGENCDGVKYTSKLRRDLLRVLRDERNRDAKNYYFGFLEVSREEHNKNLDIFLAEEELPVRWDNGDFLHQSNRTGVIFPLIRSLRQRSIMYVGPEHLKKLNKNRIFRINDFVEVPMIGAYEEIKRIHLDVVERVERDQLIAVSMGIGAKVLIHDLYYEIGDSHQIIDFGSIFDGYVGVFSRKYFKRVEWIRNVRLNVGLWDD